MIYRNAEGYPDPTAGEALANVYREQRAALWAQAIREKHNDRPKSAARRARCSGPGRRRTRPKEGAAWHEFSERTGGAAAMDLLAAGA